MGRGKERQSKSRQPFSVTGNLEKLNIKNRHGVNVPKMQMKIIIYVLRTDSYLVFSHQDIFLNIVMAHYVTKLACLENR